MNPEANSPPAFSLFPRQGSTVAGDVDLLFLFIVGVSVFFAVITAILLVYFAIRYRRRGEDHYPKGIVGSHKLEVGWALFLLPLFLVMFAWGAALWLKMLRPPADATEVYVVGKQWMWQLQHPEGQREINELHVPVGRPIKLVMTSEDVIHSFFIPDFRVKQDVLPGRYTYMNFTATTPGRYHLFCTEYCGTQHSKMIGWVTVMERGDYEQWINAKADLSMAQRGRQIFLKQQCIACHNGDASARAPSLEELYMKRVELTDGRSVVADDDYIRESIRQPRAKIAAGSKPIMPAFPREQLDDVELQQLLDYIKHLGRGQYPARNEHTPPPETKEPLATEDTEGTESKKNR
jgi:cytochrome c oxidase subunit 2